MIITELYEGQGLGNQLWVYAASRSIAEHLNLPFAILGESRFKGRGFLNIDYGSRSADPARPGSDVPGTSPAVFHERVFYDPELEYVSSDFDESVISVGADTRLEGLFQSERYFFGDVSRIERYIPIGDEALAAVSIPENVCILNIRGGEYKRHKRLILPRSYWTKAMSKMRTLTGVDSFLIVTDDPRYVASLLPGIPVLRGGIMECYVALHKAKNVIVSNSSFAYFPVKTGRRDRLVIAPKHWARFGNRWSRWASPANLYESWLWQDVTGALHTYADCLHEQEQTRAYYRLNYYLLTLPSAVMRPSPTGRLPKWLKDPVKRGLSLLLPRRIG